MFTYDHALSFSSSWSIIFIVFMLHGFIIVHSFRHLLIFITCLTIFLDVSSYFNLFDLFLYSSSCFSMVHHISSFFCSLHHESDRSSCRMSFSMYFNTLNMFHHFIMFTISKFHQPSSCFTMSHQLSSS